MKIEEKIKKPLHIRGLKRKTLVQHEYHYLSDYNCTPVTSPEKLEEIPKIVRFAGFPF